jgi:signal transduction histidine kinase
VNVRRIQWQAAVAGAMFVGVAVVTVAIVRREPSFALIAGDDASLAAEVVAALMLVAAAAATWRIGNAFPFLLLGVAITWLAAEWGSPAAGPAFTFGLVLYAAWPPLLAWAALIGLEGQRLDRTAVLVLATALGSGVGMLGLASAMVFDPPAQGCLACPANLLLLVDAPAWVRGLGQMGLSVTVLWVSAYAVLAGVHLVRSSPARRRRSAPVLVPAVAGLLLWGADAQRGVARGFVSNDQTERNLRLAQAIALALVAVGVAVAQLRAHATRAALARLVLHIGQAPAPGEVRSWLAESLRDPTLALLYRLEGDQWIDADGHAASLSPPSDREVTRVRVGGEEMLAVVHRPRLLDDPTLLAELVTTARLALEHDRLHASSRARLEQLRASRTRIVVESDLRRRELEHDLHDGAQQRLVAVALAIRLARRQLATDDADLEPCLAAAEAGVRDAVVSLREVAHGLFPAVLAEEGLTAALEELSEQLPRLVLGELPSGRFPNAVESAAYFAIVESLRLSAHEVKVDVVAVNDRLDLRIGTSPQPASAWVHVLDRVGAVGGIMDVSDEELRVEMPCAS